MLDIKSCKYPSIQIDDYVWENIDDIFISQQGDFTCLLAAFRMILRYYNIDINEQTLIEILGHEKFEIFDFGIYLSFLGVIALKLGLNIFYRTTLRKQDYYCNSIISNNKIIRSIISDDAQTTNPDDPAAQCYEAMIRILDLGGKIFLHQPYSPPSFKEIKAASREKRPIITLIEANEYYKIDEDWNHALVLLPNEKRQFIVLDSFEEIGDHYYPNWEKYIDYSRKFNWKKWNGDMIEFQIDF
jgi:hypothetical protein